MVSDKTFRCQLVTPEAALADVRARSAVFTAHDGEMGVLFNRAPLLCELGNEKLKIETDSGIQLFRIEGGFAQVLDNELTVLTSQATAVGDRSVE